MSSYLLSFPSLLSTCNHHSRHCYYHTIFVPVIVIIIPSLVSSWHRCYHHTIIIPVIVTIVIIIIPSLLSICHNHSRHYYHHTIVVIIIPSLLSPWSYCMKNTVIPLLLLRPQSRRLLFGWLVCLCPVSSSRNQVNGLLVYGFQICSIL